MSSSRVEVRGAREVVRAIAVGWAFLWAFFEYIFPLVVSPGEWLFVRGIADIRLWWPNIAHVLVPPVALLACAASGWIVATFHRRAMVLTFAATVFGWNAMLTVPALMDGRPLDRVVPEMIVELVLIPLSIAGGGLLRTPVSPPVHISLR